VRKEKREEKWRGEGNREMGEKIPEKEHQKQIQNKTP